MIVPAGFAFANFLTVAIVVATLYFTREVLVPLVLALLLSFMLFPIVRFLQRNNFPKTLAVFIALITAAAIAASLSIMVLMEAQKLANDLPRYRATLAGKAQVLREKAGASVILNNASELMKWLGREFDGHESNKTIVEKQVGDQIAPIPVEVRRPDQGASATLIAIIKPLTAPFATFAIVVIFVAFFLFQREDLRDRFIRLAGTGNLQRTTGALNEAAQRLSKLFAAQLALNAAFGAVIGVGLSLIGVPGAPLWGLLGMVLRFVPYIGAALAAALPIVLGAAVGPDWSMAAWTIGLFVLVESVTGNILEPLVCGRSAGLSPVAVVVAASFWTWLWGPIGLLLSTPVTLCVVVMARHVDRLQFIDIMLGDQTALTAQQAAYQRMLTGDPVEAIEQSRAFVKENGVSKYYDEVLLAALKLAQHDAEQGRLDNDRLENIHKTVFEIVDDLDDHPDPASVFSDTPKEIQTNRQVSNVQFGDPIFCIPGMGRLDEAAVLVVCDFLKRQKFNARISGLTTAIENDSARAICVCYLENVSSARIDYAVRKLSRQTKSARITVCLLGEDNVTAAQSTKRPRSLHEISAAYAHLLNELKAAS